MLKKTGDVKLEKEEVFYFYRLLRPFFKCIDRIILDVMIYSGKMMNQHRKCIFYFEIPQYTDKYIQPPIVTRDLANHIV